MVSEGIQAKVKLFKSHMLISMGRHMYSVAVRSVVLVLAAARAGIHNCLWV